MVETRNRKMCSMSNNNSDNLPDLPHEVIVEILSWVPPKKLWPFRFVSKSWFNLLNSDQHFINLHSHRSIQTQTTSSKCPIILVAKKQEPWKPIYTTIYLAPDFSACDNAVSLKTPIPQGNIGYKISGICNGLVCLSPFQMNNEIYIWNPVTADHIAISHPPISACFPAMDHENTSYLAFGFHPSTNEYKVVSVYCEYEELGLDNHMQFSVYTLGKDSSWRIVQPEVHCQFDSLSSYFNNIRLVNGVLHWIAINSGGPYDNIIVGFDMKDEVLRGILPPRDVNLNDDEPHGRRIEELGGLLSLFTQHDNEDLQVWVMKQYGVVDSWTKQFTIRNHYICWYFQIFKPLGVYNGGILMHSSQGLVLCNPQTDAVMDLKKIGFHLSGAHTYVESIISPRAIIGAGHILT